jgi:TRAP-type C4-dicarboxylate transport system permease small subunit
MHPMTRLTETAERALGWVTGLVLFAMMALTFVDVCARYLFNAPIPGAFEITQLLLAVIVFTALPIVTGREQHVSISLVEQVLNGTAKKVQCVLVSLIGAAGLGYLAWMLWRQGGRLARYGDYTAHLKLPLAPYAFLMAVLCGVSAAILLWLALTYLRRPARDFERGATGGTL